MGPARLAGLRAVAVAMVAASAWLASPAGAATAFRQAVAEIEAVDPEVMEGVDDPTTYYSDLHACPRSCSDLLPSGWDVYSDFDRLDRCKQSMLFDFALNVPVADPTTPTRLRVCALGNGRGNSTKVDPLRKRSEQETEEEASAKKVCQAVKTAAAASERGTTLELAHGGVGAGANTADAVAAARTALSDLVAYFDSGRAPCTETTMFSYQKGAIAGVYIGQSFGGATLSTVAKELLKQIESSGAPTQALQLCGKNRNAHHVLGLVVDTANNITAVQNAVRGWHDAECLAEYESKTEIQNVPIWEDKVGLDPSLDFSGNGTANGTANATLARRWHHRLHGSLDTRADDCRVEKAIPQDGCWQVAQRCGITVDEIIKYNAKGACDAVTEGKRFCCSPGTLPDIRPKPQDGKCFKYLTQKGDNCGKIAAAHGIDKWEDIDKYNNKTTWGWWGCGRVMPDTYICLSEGKPPMPFPIPNAVCGPTKPDSTEPSGHHTLLEVSPCPLNACCNIWGQCGISGDFCTEKESESGNPGTSGAKDGCVMNCGMDIVKSTIAKPLGRIGYYETWNFNRPCLHMFADSINRDGGYTYTIIHWAFADVNTADWTVKINDTFNQWASFKALKNVKRVISFGGWAFSNEPSTYDILRQGMNPTNRERFAKNIADFVRREGIDGVDFDWEYPGATDIDGTPGGFETDGPWYFRFLETMRQALGNDKTLSIAAPASFWYLKNFPIRGMAKYLDYIVYMTYDLHGQWDYTTPDKKSYIDGCPQGNCIRSHVNLTETSYALSMITKAGVASHLIYVGESSYGRSFKLAEPGCKGPMCQFLGTRLESPAKKGRCTDVSGYISNAEIQEIIGSLSDDADTGIKGEAWHDGASNSDMLLYDETEWVAYMSETTRETRRLHWLNFNMGGTIDWAVDLRSFSSDDFRDPKTGGYRGGEDKQPLPPALADCKATNFDTLEKIRDASGLPEHCAALYSVEVLSKKLKDAMASYEELMKSGYDKKFDTYADAVVGSGTKTVREWVYNNGEKFFTCKVTEEVVCCQKCNSDNECKRCSSAEDVCLNWRPVCDNPQGNDPILFCETTNTWLELDEPCPPNYSMRNYKYDMRGMFPTTKWSLRSEKANEFYAELYKATGIAQEDIKLKDLQSFNECSSGADPSNRCENVGWDRNFPVPEGFEKSDVTNPKTIVSDAYNNLKDISRDLPTAAEKIRKGSYDGLAQDLADAIALPVFMIEEAVAGIKSISDAIDEAEREREKNIIIAFLTSIFFFIPIIGQLVGTVAALANIGRIIAILGTLGEVAIDIYSVVDTKGNDPLVIFGLVLAPLAIFDVIKIARAASVARAMKQDDYGKLGKNIKDKMDVYRGAASKHRTCALKPKGKRDVEVFPVGGLPMSSLNADPVWSEDF